MTAINQRKRLIKEIESLPEEALVSVEKVVLEEKQKSEEHRQEERQKRVERLLALAGAWSDWEDAEFDRFMDGMAAARREGVSRNFDDAQSS